MEVTSLEATVWFLVWEFESIFGNKNTEGLQWEHD